MTRMNRMNLWAGAVLMTIAFTSARADDIGPYVQVSAGQTTYDFDCGFYSCPSVRGNTVKLGAGYRFGVFALEVWGTDWGRAPVYDYYGDDAVRLRSLGVSGAWRMHFGTMAEGVLRAGFAEVQQSRNVERLRHLEGTFGLGLSFDIFTASAIEIGWDITTSTGGDKFGSALAQAATLGLRVRF